MTFWSAIRLVFRNRFNRFLKKVERFLHVDPMKVAAVLVFIGYVILRTIAIGAIAFFMVAMAYWFIGETASYVAVVIGMYAVVMSLFFGIFDVVEMYSAFEEAVRDEGKEKKDEG